MIAVVANHILTPLSHLEVATGEVEIQGGIYDLETGRVEFLGASPNQAALVKSGAAMPPSIK